MKSLISILFVFLTIDSLKSQQIYTPYAQCYNVSISNITTTSFKVNWSLGSGPRSVVVVRPTSYGRVVPYEGALISYPTGGAYGQSAGNLGNYNYVVDNLYGTNYTTVTGLTPNTNYEVVVYSYDYGCLTYISPFGCLGGYGSLMNSNYSTSNSEQHLTLADQPIVAPTLSLIGTGVTTATLGFTGSSNYNLVYAYPTQGSYYYPVDGTYYPASTTYGSGAQVGGSGTNNFVVHNNNANGSVNITNLTPATPYYAFVYSYNGTYYSSVNNSYNYLNSFTWVYFATYNYAPTVNSISNYTVCQDAATTVLHLSGIGDGSVDENQTVSFSAYSSNTTLLPNPTISYTHPNTTGTLSFKPNAGQSGTVTITLNAYDGGPNNSQTSKTFTVTVLGKPADAGVITTSATTLCQVKNGVVFTVPTIDNATAYNWSFPSGSTVTAGANTRSVTVAFNTTASAHNVKLYGSNTNGCGDGATSALLINFDKVPTVSNAGPNQQICNNLTAMAANTPSVGTAAWTYCSSGLGSISGTTMPNSNLQVVNGQTVTSVWEISNGVCLPSRDTIIVTNIFGHPSCTPNADFLASNTSPCVSTPITFFNTSVGTTSSTWLFGATATPSVAVFSTTATASNSVSVTYSTVGPKTVTLSITGVGSPPPEIKTNYINVITTPAPPLAISGNTLVCQGKLAEPFSIAAVTDATDYSWTFPTDVVQNTGGNTNAITANFLATALSGNVRVTANNACGISAPTSLSVTTSPLPTTASSIAGSITVCQGMSSLNYVANSLNNANSYSWSLPTGINIVGGSNTSNITVDVNKTATSGTLSVFGTNGCGDGVTQEIAVTVNPLPEAAGVISGSVSILTCPTPSISLNYSVATINNATSYDWVYPSGYTPVSGGTTNSILIDATIYANSGNFKVSGKNACGNGDTSMAYFVNVNGLPSQQLCVVTVDSLSKHNEVFWQKNGISGVDSFRVYRVKTLVLDTLIGTLAYSELGQFVDTTSNPNVTSYTYKIAAVDLCGNEGPKSSPHQTIHLQSIYSMNPKKTDLSWNLYSGASVNSYRVLRDTNNTGNWVILDNSLAPNVTSYTDLNIPPTAISLQYRVDVLWSNSCNPTAKVAAQSVINTTKSNTKDFITAVPTDTNVIDGIQEKASGINLVKLYPNPTRDLFNIEFASSIDDFSVELYNQLGSKLATQHFVNSNKATINMSDYSDGIYFVVIKNNQFTVTKRITKF